MVQESNFDVPYSPSTYEPQRLKQQFGKQNKNAGNTPISTRYRDHFEQRGADHATRHCSIF